MTESQLTSKSHVGNVRNWTLKFQIFINKRFKASYKTLVTVISRIQNARREVCIRNVDFVQTKLRERQTGMRRTSVKFYSRLLRLP